MMEFTIVSNEIQYIVTRNSKLAGPRRSASQWINWHRKTTPTAHPLRSKKDIRKLVNLTEQIRQKCTDETPIRLPNSSHNYESGEERPESIPLYQNQRWHSSSSSSSTSWWQWNEHWWSSYFLKKKIVARSFKADCNLLQPTGV